MLLKHVLVNSRRICILSSLPDSVDIATFAHGKIAMFTAAKSGDSERDYDGKIFVCSRCFQFGEQTWL